MWWLAPDIISSLEAVLLPATASFKDLDLM
jgi:hypothetical protein